MLHDLVGIGMRPTHYEQLTYKQQNIGWLEVHSENHFDINSEATYYLDKACERYPISLHGVGLSLTSSELIDTVHLSNIKKLITRYQPFNVSEHLSWSTIAGQHYDGLQAIPYTEQNLNHVIARVKQIQDFLEHPIAIENPANYTTNQHNNMTEIDFLLALQAATGCSILLDINNVYISSKMLRFAASDYLTNMPTQIVSEIHLSGCNEAYLGNKLMFNEEHGHPINPEVWKLFELYLQKSSTIPTLIEWDTNIPMLAELLLEVSKARHLIVKANNLKQTS